jgi:long-chain acyl-CoA synthetase
MRQNPVVAPGSACPRRDMPRNIAQFFGLHLGDPSRVLYRHWSGERWVDVTAGMLAVDVARWQAAFRRDGLTPGDRVAICARNGPAWVAVDLAALGMGLVVVPAYVDDNAENAAWCVAHAQAKLMVVANARLAAAFARVAATHALPPRVVLQPDGGAQDATPVDRYLPAAGDDVEIADLPPDTLATICFTSGTAGRPKGVMLTHDNIVANVRQCEATGMARPDDEFLSILPLSHMFERTGGYYLPLAIGARVTFSRGVAQLADDFATQKPTVVFAVPRIFELFRTRILQTVGPRGRRRALFDACVSRGYRYAQRTPTPLDRVLAPVLQRRVGRRVLARLGGRLRLAVVGGAPLDPALSRTFIGLGLTMLQGYGMTEASPVIAVNHADDNRPETVGPPLDGIEVRLADNGELLVRGPNVMRGYWRDEAATAAAIDAERFLHTGDLAEIADGRIRIKGRAKDIFVMSSGEKLPPHDVELAILRDPVFEQVMLVGDGEPYVVLLAVTRETDERKLARRANAQLTGFPRWARVRHVIATPVSWSVDSGLVTPTLKLRRQKLQERFADEIARAYGTEPVD